MSLLGGRLGVPRSIFYVAWPAEQFLCQSKYRLIFVLTGKLVTSGPHVVEERDSEVKVSRPIHATNFRPGVIYRFISYKYSFLLIIMI